MSQRLQVLFEAEELEEIRRAAQRSRMTVAEWVRQMLREALRSGPRRARDEKLRALERALEHSFPTGNIDQILAETARGYGPLP
jgi:hypothetical protein